MESNGFLQYCKNVAVAIISELSQERNFVRNLGNKYSKSAAEWDKEWICIDRLKDSNLYPYNHCVGLYRHVINGKTMYVGRTIELNNGGFRKRLSDYRRDSDSLRKHKSGRTIHEHFDEITTYLLIVGDNQDVVTLTKQLDGQFIAWYGFSEWNKQINI